MEKKKIRFVNIFTEDDSIIEKVRLWRNQEHVKKYMYNQHDISIQEHINYIEKLRNDKNKGLYIIYANADIIGVFQYSINSRGNYLESGNYLTDEKYMGCGYGVIILYMLIEIAFKYLKVNKVYSEILGTNKKVISMHKKMGIIQEGLLRNQIILNGQYCDIYQFGIFENEWDNCKNKTKKIIDKFVVSSDIKDIIV